MVLADLAVRAQAILRAVSAVLDPRSAVAVAAASRGLTARQVEVVLDGGSLFIDWRTDNHVVMSGPVVVAFTGTLEIATGAA